MNAVPGSRSRPPPRHYRSLQQLFRWLEAEEEIAQSPFRKMTPPAVPEQPVPLLSADQIKQLLDGCKGNDFDARRDTAIFRLLLDSGLRVAELVGVTLRDLDFEQDVVLVLGKGRRERAAPFGNRTGEALGRYLRVRGKHPLAGRTDAVWLGRKGPMTDSGVRQMMERRGRDAGIQGLHPHQLRHQFAHQWLAAGGVEQDLMRLAGWRSRQMLGGMRQVRQTSGHGPRTDGSAWETGFNARNWTTSNGWVCNLAYGFPLANLVQYR